MKNKFLFMSLFAICFALIAVPAVSAAGAIISPVLDNNYTGTVNISMDTDVGDGVLNITCYYNASGGEASTFWFDIVNTTDNQTNFEDSVVDIDALTDSATYNVSCTTYATGVLANDTSSVNVVTFDSTDPTSALTITPSSQTFDRPLNYKCTATDALDSIAVTTLVVAHPSDDTTSSTTLTANDAGVIAFSDTDYAGDYVFTCTITDNAGNTDSSTATRNVAVLGGAAQPAGGIGGDGMSTQTLVIIGLVILGAFLLLNKK